jgi:hypothetical protein
MKIKKQIDKNNYYQEGNHYVKK